MTHDPSTRGPMPPRGKILEAIQEAVSRSPRIAAAYLYGSAAAERTSLLSDIDVAVLFGEEVDQRARFRLCSELASAIERAAPGRQVDLLDLEELPLTIQGRVLTDGLLAAANDHVRRVRFEAMTRMLYFDFLPTHESDVAEGLKALRKRLGVG